MAQDAQKLEDLCKKTYKEQAIWFLNAFWGESGVEAEQLWAYAQKSAELDSERKKEGFELDELNAHRFLEHFHETMTVREMRDNLRAKGAIGDRVKYIPLTHYLAVRYDIDWHRLVNAPQGRKEDVEEAQRRLDEVNRAVEESQIQAEAAKAAERESKAREAESKKREAEAKAAEAQAKAQEADALAKEAEAKAREAEAVARENEAKAREDEARAREDELREANREVEETLAELKRQEAEYQAKKEELERKKEEGSVVQRNKAANELAQLLAEDPLPLRRAKINQEAAVRKAERAIKPFADARAVAEAATAEASAARAVASGAAAKASAARAEAEASARAASAARAQAEAAAREAEAAARAAEQAAAQAEAALEEAQERLREAEEYFETVKNTMGNGTSWWFEREIHEQRKYLPTSRGGIAKN